MEEPSIKSAPEEAGGTYAFSSGMLYSDPDFDVTFDYQLTADKDYQVLGATFGVTNDQLGVLSNEEFIMIAELYIRCSG